MSAIDARNVLRDRAEAILAELGDWEYEKGGNDYRRCIACSHSVPRHDDRCIAWRLAIRCAEAERPRLL